MSTKSEPDQDFLFRFGLIGGKTTVVEAKNYLERIEASHKGQLNRQNKQLLEWAKQMVRYQEILEDICSAEIKEGQKDKRPLAQIIEEVYPHWKEYKIIKADTIAELNKIEEIKNIQDLPGKVKYTVKVVQFCEILLNHLYTPLDSFDEYYKGQKEKTTKIISKYSEYLLIKSKVENRSEESKSEGSQLQVIKTYLWNIWHEGFETYEDLIQDVELRARLKSFKVRIAQFKRNQSDKMESVTLRERIELTETNKQINELRELLSKTKQQKEQICNRLKNLSQKIDNMTKTNQYLKKFNFLKESELMDLQEVNEKLQNQIEKLKESEQQHKEELWSLRKKMLICQQEKFPQQSQDQNLEQIKKLKIQLDDQRLQILNLSLKNSEQTKKSSMYKTQISFIQQNLEKWKKQFKTKANNQMKEYIRIMKQKRILIQQKYLQEIQYFKSLISSNPESVQKKIHQISQAVLEKNTEIEQLKASLSESQKKNTQEIQNVQKLEKDIKDKDSQLQQISLLKCKLTSQSKENERNSLKLLQLTGNLKEKQTKIDNLKKQISEMKMQKINFNHSESKLKQEKQTLSKRLTNHQRKFSILEKYVHILEGFKDLCYQTEMQVQHKSKIDKMCIDIEKLKAEIGVPNDLNQCNSEHSNSFLELLSENSCIFLSHHNDYS